MCNLVRRPFQVIELNTNLGVMTKCYVEVIEVHKQLTLYKRDYPR